MGPALRTAGRGGESAPPARPRAAPRRLGPDSRGRRHDSGAAPEAGGPAGLRTDAEPDFLDCYHSTLMAAFAAALTVDRLARRPRTRRRPPRTPDRECPDDRHRVSCTHVGVRALEWLYAHRDGFRLEVDVDPEIGFLERFKPVGELALICTGAVPRGRGRIPTGRAGTAVDRPRLAAHPGRRPDAGARAARRAPLAHPLRGYLPFKELGYSSPEVERAARLNQRLGQLGRPGDDARPAPGPVRASSAASACRPPRRRPTSSAPPGWAAHPNPGPSRAHRLRRHPHRLPPHRLGREPRRSARRTSPTTSRTGCPSGSTTGWTCNAGTCSANCSSSTPVCPAPRSTSGPGRASPPPSSPTARCPPCAPCPQGDPDEVFDLVLPPHTGRRLRLRPGHLPRPDAAGAPPS